jgi:integrase/recombinase XerD
MKESSMLTRYFKDPLTLESYRAGPAGPYLDEFIRWLEEQGYRRRCIRRHLRGANHFLRWARRARLTDQNLDAEALAAFGKYLQKHHCLKYPSGPHNHNFVGARHIVRFLEATGRVARSVWVELAPAEPELLLAFRRWMQTQRGTTEATLNNYRLPLLDLLQTLGDQPEQFEAKALRDFILDRARHRGIEQAKTAVTAVRMFLRFLIAMGRCTPGLEHAIPTIARWRLASLPKYLPAEDVERVIASCDLTTLIGVRDRAVLLLLARLGLRAGDVAALKLGYIDWQGGALQVVGKNRRTSRLPLPQEVGDAILDYFTQRPPVTDDHLFITTRGPFKGLSYQTVGQIATRAIQQAGVKAPVHGAHLLRHSAATEMLRQGLSLTAIGIVLRHASIETTTIYAKVDRQRLRQVARPWPEVLPC